MVPLPASARAKVGRPLWKLSDSFTPGGRLPTEARLCRFQATLRWPSLRRSGGDAQFAGLGPSVPRPDDVGGVAKPHHLDRRLPIASVEPGHARAVLDE